MKNNYSNYLIHGGENLTEDKLIGIGGCYVFMDLHNKVYHLRNSNATVLLTGNPPNLATIFGKGARKKAKEQLELIEGVKLIPARRSL